MSTNITPYTGQILALSCAVIWAFAVILFRKSTFGVEPLIINFFKNITACVLIFFTALLCGLTSEQISHENLLLLAISGILGIYFGDSLFLSALSRIGVSLTFIITCFYAPFVILGAGIFLHEKISASIILGGFLITSGTLILSIDKKGIPPGLERKTLLTGLLLGFTGTVSSAIGVIVSKHALEQTGLLNATVIRLVAGTVPLVIHLIITGRSSSMLRIFKPSKIHKALFPATFLGAYLSMIIWLGGIKYTKASTASLLNQTSPAFGILLAAIFLDEKLTSKKITGTVLALTGIFVVFLF